MGPGLLQARQHAGIPHCPAVQLSPAAPGLPAVQRCATSGLELWSYFNTNWVARTWCKQNFRAAFCSAKAARVRAPLGCWSHENGLFDTRSRANTPVYLQGKLDINCSKSKNLTYCQGPQGDGNLMLGRCHFNPPKQGKALSLKTWFQRYGKVLQESPTCRTHGVHKVPVSGTFLRKSSLDAGGQCTELAAPGLCRVLSLLRTLLSKML